MELDALIEQIHEVGLEWDKRAEEADRTGAIPTESAALVRDLNAHRLLQPTQFGGGQHSIEAHTRAVAAIGEYCMATAWCAAVWSAHNWMASLFPIEGQAELWENPTALLSASIVPKNAFALDGDDVMVQGRFSFASGCDHADWFGVGGMVELGGPVICLFPRDPSLIDASSWDVVGLSGTGSKDLVIDEPIRVPRHRVLFSIEAAEGRAPGQLHHDNPLYRCPFRATAALVLAAPVIGAAKAAVTRFVERLDSHVIMARGGSQRSDPAAGARLAESAAEVNAAELVLLEAAQLLDALGSESDPHPERVASIFRDTGYSVRLATRAVDRVYEASGGSALRRAEPIQRLWRDVNAARTHAIMAWDGSAQIYADAVLGS